MTPTPISASHVLAVRYAISSLVHTWHIYCSAVPSGDSTGYSLHCESTADVGISTALSQIATLLAPITPTGSTGAGFTLYDVVGTALVPLTTGSWSMTGTGGALIPATQMTLCMRDGLNLLAKVVLFELPVTVPYAWRDEASIPGDLGAFADSVMSNSAGNIGAFLKSRSDGFPDRFVSLITTVNRKVRRRRGVA